MPSGLAERRFGGSQGCRRFLGSLSRFPPKGRIRTMPARIGRHGSPLREIRHRPHLVGGSMAVGRDATVLARPSGTGHAWIQRTDAEPRQLHTAPNPHGATYVSGASLLFLIFIHIPLARRHVGLALAVYCCFLLPGFPPKLRPPPFTIGGLPNREFGFAAVGRVNLVKKCFLPHRVALSTNRTAIV